MGWGDELLGSGIARGARARGVRIAFGDGKHIQWHANAHQIFQGNPNVAPPGSEHQQNLEWVRHYSGHRLYHHEIQSDRWNWNPEFRASPGEVFFTNQELAFARTIDSGFVVIEPNVKYGAPNKQWSQVRYRAVARYLLGAGQRVVQFTTGPCVLDGVQTIRAPSFRCALAVLARAWLYIGPEGGLHHGSAAVGLPAVVIFSGYISPLITGYRTHINLYRGDGGPGCGFRSPCEHCRDCLGRISVDDVIGPARLLLRGTREASHGILAAR